MGMVVNDLNDYFMRDDRASNPKYIVTVHVAGDPNVSYKTEPDEKPKP